MLTFFEGTSSICHFRMCQATARSLIRSCACIPSNFALMALTSLPGFARWSKQVWTGRRRLPHQRRMVRRLRSGPSKTSMRMGCLPGSSRCAGRRCGWGWATRTKGWILARRMGRTSRMAAIIVYYRKGVISTCTTTVSAFYRTRQHQTYTIRLSFFSIAQAGGK